MATVLIISLMLLLMMNRADRVRGAGGRAAAAHLPVRIDLHPVHHQHPARYVPAASIHSLLSVCITSTLYLAVLAGLAAEGVAPLTDRMAWANTFAGESQYADIACSIYAIPGDNCSC